MCFGGQLKGDSGLLVVATAILPLRYCPRAFGFYLKRVGSLDLVVVWDCVFSMRSRTL
jgi:hypothetical protein